MSTAQLTDGEKKLIFWGSFLSLAAASFGFVLRVMLPDIWIREFNITAQEAGSVAGMALWPIAITMILFSLIVDKVGYRRSMFVAFALQAASVVFTVMATNVAMLKLACLCAGFGHGVVEACINPLCANIYKEDKTKMLNILHASWPAGMVAGGVVFLLFQNQLAWRTIFFFMLIPVLAYGYAYYHIKVKLVDERVEHNIPMSEMLKEFGGLGAFLAITFLLYEVLNQLQAFTGVAVLGGHARLIACAVVGAVGGVLVGSKYTKGRVLFFLLCLIMIPLATAELATDHWIKTLMTPVLRGEYNMDAGWAIVASAFIMMVLRFFVGIPLKYTTPPGLILLSSAFSIVGLFWLSSATGVAIFIAFCFYGIGQTFFWGTMLGFVSEQFPKGGALTLNTITAMGLLTVGIFGFPFLGAVKDGFDARTVQREQPELYGKYTSKADFFGITYNTIKVHEVLADEALTEPAAEAPEGEEAARQLTAEGKALVTEVDQSARNTLKVSATLPLVMAIFFLGVILYYRSKGGYKPVILGTKEKEEDEVAAELEEAAKAEPGF